MKRPQAMIFDMDGTLFKTETLLIPATARLFARLQNEGLYDGPIPTNDAMLSSLGMLLDDIWKRVIPTASDEARARANELLLEEELAGLQMPGTELYPEVLETLTALREQGVKLFVASNGLEHYVNGVADAHGITSLFDGLYSAGGYQTASKVDLVRILLEEHGIESAWMIGDRSSDVEAGKHNQLEVIGCLFAGYGQDEELKDSDVLINEFRALLPLYEASK